MKINYGSALRSGFEYLLANFPEVVVLGQGLWSPWYVGNTMTDLDKQFGKERIFDTPVSEAACTGLAVGAAVAGLKPVIVHPRMDFMLYAMDQIVNEAANWSYMFGGKSSAGLTIRGIINRGGSQGAQHSQALHGLFSHIPGLRVVMPFSVNDARDLLISSVLSPDPVIYIDDKWLYSTEDTASDISIIDISTIGPKVIETGKDLTVVGCGYTTKIAIDAANLLREDDINIEVIDLRVVSPLKFDVIRASIEKTGRLVVIDGGWSSCGISSEILARSSEEIKSRIWKSRPRRLTLPSVPAPASPKLENSYYPTVFDLKDLIIESLNDD